MMRSVKVILSFCLLTSLLPGFPQQEDEPILQINNRKVYLQEFQSRLNDFPLLTNKALSEIKEDLACTLIAEAILAIEAKKESLDKTIKVRMLADQYYSEALYEQWMTSEIREKVFVTEDELINAYKKFQEQREVEYWTVQTLREANSIIEDILKGKSIKYKSESKLLEYGESLEEIEEAVYNLKTGEISKPILVDSIYYIFRLTKQIPHPDYSQNDLSYWKESIERRIRERKEKNLLDKELSNLMRGKDFEVIRDSYNFLYEQLVPIIYSKKKNKTEAPELIQNEIGLKETGGENKFNQPLIKFNDGKVWTTEEFWVMLSVSPYPLNYKNPADLRIGLMDVIKKTVLLNSVVNDAVKKNYYESNYTKAESEMWRTNILASVLMEKYRGEINISEAELLQYYDSVKHSYIKPEMRRIVPIVVKDKKLAEEIFNKINNGVDIISLAEKYNQNIYSIDINNPGIFITEYEWGKIGKEAFELEVGQLSKIITSEDSTYSIIKLLEIHKSLPYSFEEIHDKLNMDYENKLLQRSINDILEEKASQYKIKLNRELLNKVEYFGGNMLIKKTHFPLRNAVSSFPLFNHKADWYSKILQ